MKPNFKINNNDNIIFCYKKPEEKYVKPEKMKLDILYEDDYLIIINKDNGIITHPAVNVKSGTLVNGLMYLRKLEIKNQKYQYDNIFRPGVVHRLDKDTSGLIIFAKNSETQQAMNSIFKNREITKIYYGIVHGKIKEDEGIISYPISRNPDNRKQMCISRKGKPSITEFEVIDKNDNYSLLKLDLKTGRTHQIRVHLQAINHPIVGDNEYSKNKNKEILKLHSYYIRFKHPVFKKKLELVAPLKQHFICFCKENNLRLKYINL